MADIALLLATLLLSFLAYRRPPLAGGYVLASFALEQCAQAFSPLAGRNDSLCNYLIAGMVVIGILGKIVREGTAFLRLSASSLAVMLLIAYCFATILWSIFPATTGENLNTSLPYLVVFVGLAPLLIGGPQDMESLLGGFLWSASAALVVLLVFADWGARGIELPYADKESNPLAITQAAGALLIALAFAPQIRRIQAGKRWFLVAATLLVVLVTFLRTGSRGQVVAALATTIIFSLLGKGGKWIPLVLLGVAGLLATGFLEDEVSKNSARWDTDQVEGDILDGRVGKAEQILSFWSASAPTHIWLGLGHATARDPRLLGTYPHVVPAEVLAEEGLVGSVLYLVALLTAAVLLRRAYITKAVAARPIIIGTAAMLFYEFLLTLKQGTLFGAASFLLLLVLPGALASRTRNVGVGVATEAYVPFDRRRV